MMRVRFVRPHSPYNAGEVAVFLPQFAQKLISAGVAEVAESMTPLPIQPTDKAVHAPPLSKRRAG